MKVKFYLFCFIDYLEMMFEIGADVTEHGMLIELYEEKDVVANLIGLKKYFFEIP
jgi:hypothetical protein